MNWNDLRYVLALHRCGTMTGAAEELGVNHATVGRRISALDAELGTPLFAKTTNGWELTDTGQALLEPVEHLEEAALRVERVARCSEVQLAGVVRIAASQFLNQFLVVPATADLTRLEPAIRVDVLEGVDFVSLARQEADLAIRMTQDETMPGGPNVRMTKLGAIPWAMCAHRSVVERHEIELPLDSASNVPLLTYNQRAPSTPDLCWVERTPSPNVVYSTNSMYGMLAAVVQGLGVGLIPRAYAGGEVVVVSETLVEMNAWLAVHPDLRRNPRIEFTHDFLKDWVARRPKPFAD